MNDAQTEVSGPARGARGSVGRTCIVAMVVSIFGLLAACSSANRTAGSASSSPAGPTTTSGSATKGSTVAHPPPPDCGPIPTSTGPAAPLATVHLSAPASAASGSTVTVSATLRVTRDAGRIVTYPSRSQVLVVRSGRVVGRSVDLRSELAVPLTLRRGTTRPIQAVPSSVRLSGCPEPSSDNGRVALVPGAYGLVAVLGYMADALNGAPDAPRVPGSPYALVSSAVTITVT